MYISEEKLKDKIFMMLPNEDNENQEENLDVKYVQIKSTQHQKRYPGDEQMLQLTTIQFIDISNTILYDKFKAQNVFLELINACVSHELRNPLHSIIAQNIQKSSLYEEIIQLLEQLEIQLLDKEGVEQI